MSLQETMNEVRELVEPFAYDYNTDETRAAIINAISEHPAVGVVYDKTTPNDIDNQQGKFGVEVNGIHVTIKVDLL